MRLSVIFKYVEYYENKVSSLLFLNAAAFATSKFTISLQCCPFIKPEVLYNSRKKSKEMWKQNYKKKRKKEKGKNTSSVQSAASSEHLG